MFIPLLFSGIAFIAVILFCIGLFFIVQEAQDKKTQNQRFEQAVTQQVSSQQSAQESNKENEGTVSRKDLRISTIPWLNDLFNKHLKEHGKKLMTLIDQAGLKVKVGEFLLLDILIGFIGALLVHLFLNIPIVGFGAAVIPFMMLGMLKGARTGKFIAQLPQALDLLSGNLRAGLDVMAALKHMSEEFPAPLGEEFGKVVIEINLGLTLNDALNNLAKRINTMDVQMLCTGIIINRELGGNLSELTSGIAETVRERFRLKGMIKALTAENQGSAILLLILPIALYIILNMLAPSTYNSFATDPTGRMILIGCAVSMTFGYLVIQQITKLEV